MCDSRLTEPSPLVEAFYSMLKTELVNRQVRPTRAQGQWDIFDFVEVYHNPQRLHTMLGYPSPAD